MIFSRSFLALLRRNFIYRKRNWISSIVEFALPIAGIGILVAIKNAADNSPSFQPTLVPPYYPTSDDTIIPYSFTDYVTALQAKKECTISYTPPYYTTTSITGISPYDSAIPFVKCDSRRCPPLSSFDENGTATTPLPTTTNATGYCEYNILALAPSDSNDQRATSRISRLKRYIEERHPQILPNNTNLPFNHEFIQIFADSDAIDSYVTSPSYGRDLSHPKIGVAVVIQSSSSDKTYSYALRVNSTNYNSLENEARPASPTMPPTTRSFDGFATTMKEACSLQGGSPYLGAMAYENCAGQYVMNGALTMQRLVDDWIMEDSGGERMVRENGVRFVGFPEREYMKDGFYTIINPYVPLLMVLSLLMPLSTSLRSIVLEKELRQKELMKMMSVTESALGWSWFTSLYLFLFGSGLVTAIISNILYVNSDIASLIVFWELALLSCLVFTMALAAIFSKATRATLVGVLVYFCGYFLSLAVDYRTGSASLVSLLSIIHPITGLTYGLQLVGDLEDKGVGIRQTTWAFSEYPSGMTFAATVVSLVINCFFWGFMTWYLNRVVGGDFGQPLPWYFLFTREYWCPAGRASAVLEGDNDDDNTIAKGNGIPMEPVSEALDGQTNKVVIKNLTKQYGAKTAVDGLSLSMYGGQVTALLGHNGAGKTTTINMLIGMVGPSSGSATISGLDICTQMSQIRSNVGICLQHDCLFPLLTVKEHLQFFARIKGLYSTHTSALAESAILQSIKDVALLEKQNTLSRNLSGGMKRKLSVAIAFCGNSRTVFLDEPTSGMDPFSRRFTWNVIRRYREENRCIVLTTHFMDEADLLGDRIAIMGEGRLRCVGSPLFLKGYYGVGYQLTIEKKPKSETTAAGEREQSVEEKLSSIVKEAVPEGSSLLSNVGTEISFRLPLDASANFPPMFQTLDNMVDGGNIVTYGVSITTLDEVFLMVARGDTGDHTHLASSLLQNVNKTETTTTTKMATSNEDTDVSTANNNQQKAFTPPSPPSSSSHHHQTTTHIRALLQKRALNFKRDKRAWCCSTICPSLLSLMGFIIVAFAPVERNMPPLALTLEEYNLDVGSISPIRFNEAGGVFDCDPGVCVSEGVPMKVVVSATGEKYFYCGGAADGTSSSSSSPKFCSISQSTDYMAPLTTDDNVILIPDEDSINVTDVSMGLMAISELNILGASQYGALYFTSDEASTITTSSDDTSDSNIIYGKLVSNTCRVNDGNYTLEEQCNDFRGVGIVVSTNFTSLHASVLYQAIADESLLRSSLNDDEFIINPTIHPLPITKVEQGYVAGEDSFTAWFLLVLSFPFIAGSFATFIVSERESKAKHLQTVAGITPTSYWTSTYLWDIFNYQLPFAIVIASMYILDISSFTTSERSVNVGTITTLVLFGPSSAGFAYCLSFLFSSASGANMGIIVFNFLIGFAGPMVVFVLTLIGSGTEDLANLKTIAVVIEYVLRLVPAFNMSKALFYIINIESLVAINAEPDMTVWSPHVALIEIIYLGVECIAYISLAILIDKLSTKPRAVQRYRSIINCLTCHPIRNCHTTRHCHRSTPPLHPSTTTPPLPEDSDVLAEKTRILSQSSFTTTTTNTDLIVLRSLSKTYPPSKHAVSDLTFGIPPGTCFGLLGINGAGKTTTMAMLTAEFPPTSGDAILGGYSVRDEPEQIRRILGYCPQFDAHFGNMTGWEHVSLYAAIKGVNPSEIPRAVEQKLKEVGLSMDDGKRLSGGYSGGMKRKLSVACATIGRPRIVFLDEPSTGMDPVARRDLWRVISNMVTGGGEKGEKTSVILTTHSMEECEALCPTIGIMAGGKLKCLGSAQRLKTRFGRGFQVEAKVKQVSKDDDDYQSTLSSLLLSSSSHKDKDDNDDNNNHVVGSDDNNERAARTFWTLDQVKTAISAAESSSLLVTTSSSSHESLVDMINQENPTGYVVYRAATSELGIAVDELTVFCVAELRIRRLMDFFKEYYPSSSVLRERQDNKVRYEVSSSNNETKDKASAAEEEEEEENEDNESTTTLKISSLFQTIEEHKSRLQLADYGVSQTSLEQVFNMHAAEAEKEKYNTIDG